VDQALTLEDSQLAQSNFESRCCSIPVKRESLFNASITQANKLEVTSFVDFADFLFAPAPRDLE